ncbi:MAG: 30S ribosomal protein S12 methylthiotransferase RimO [Candidatus Omnitrophica bacterium]|nr:30S ribosomal protein S12 methylthiotransferase RimO [Candidatus Omnitrophota bacterium]
MKTDTAFKVHLVSLGCARTLVDSEVALGGLAKEGYAIVHEPEKADVAIVNTCGFIEEAKMESIETILRLCQMKKEGRLRAVVVLGCLAQRYGAELQKELGEVDGVIGTNSFADLPRLLAPLRNKKSEKIFDVTSHPRYLLDETTPRYRLTPPHTAYLKISEGCINACAYCVIPQMKGRHRSRSIDSIVNEAKARAVGQQTSEINLIGQDTAAYGFDRDRTFQLPQLLEALAEAKAAPWIRLLYAHPAHVTEALVETMGRHSAICRYVDFPIEHSHDAVLKRMNRAVTRAKMEWGIEALRRRMPGAAIRTTVIVGFPGETDEEFEDLLDFLRQTRFERLGTFMFSREEGSRAYDMPDQLPQKVKEERFRAVMSLQREISNQIQESFIGKEVQVLVDEKAGEDGVYYGRTEADAPEVDGQAIIHTERKLAPGDFVRMRVTDALEYDLIGAC